MQNLSTDGKAGILDKGEGVGAGGANIYFENL
jgi:hypothetical protein